MRDEKSVSKLNPLVDATDHKKNHKSGGGILSWIKSLTSTPQTKKPVKKKTSSKRRPRKGNYKGKKPNNPKAKPNKKTSSSNKPRRASKPVSKKPKNDSGPKTQKDSGPRNNKRKAPSKNTAVKKETTKKITGRQAIVKEAKKKPEPPTRALNDPRDS